MSNRIHMETEQVRSMANRLRNTAEHYDDAFEALSRRVNGLSWNSPSRERYVQRFRNLSHNAIRTANELDRLANQVMHEVDQWEEVARSFAGGHGTSSSSNFLSSNRIPPMNNEHDLALELMAPAAGKDEPIRIVRINEHEYIVLIKGTDPKDFSKANNWGAAIMAGLGLSTDFEKQVKKMIKDAGIEPTDKVHLVGHSQGGIVANHLTDQMEFMSKYNIASVTTFGSPDHKSRFLGEDQFHRYRTGDDFVPFLNLATMGTMAILLTKGISLPQAAKLALPDHKYIDSGTWNPLDSHEAYKVAYGFEQEELPFGKITQWTEFQSGEKDLKAEAGLAGSLSDFFSGDPLRVIKGAIDTPFELTDALLAGGVNLGIDAVTSLLHEPLSSQIDLYRDRAMENFAFAPTPVDMAAPLLSEGASAVQSATQFSSQLASQAAQQVFQSLNQLVVTPVF